MTRSLRTSENDATSHYERFPEPVTDDPTHGICLHANFGRVCLLPAGHRGDCAGTAESEHDAAFGSLVRLRELAAKLPNDAELGAAVRALIGGGR